MDFTAEAQERIPPSCRLVYLEGEMARQLVAALKTTLFSYGSGLNRVREDGILAVVHCDRARGEAGSPC